jgi:hypothetical protein
MYFIFVNGNSDQSATPAVTLHIIYCCCRAYYTALERDDYLTLITGHCEEIHIFADTFVMILHTLLNFMFIYFKTQIFQYKANDIADSTLHRIKIDFYFL